MTNPASGPPRQLRPTDVKRLNREWRRASQARLAVLLDSVGQPFNVGSIVRSAAAFGAEHLWLCGSTAPLSHPGVAKTALGTQRLIAATTEPDPVAAAKAAADMGLRVIAIELASGALPLHEAPLDGDVCLAVGNEDHGCSAGLLAVANAVAYIPQPGRVGSLNVAVAAAIALAEARRREWSALPVTRMTRGVYHNHRVAADNLAVEPQFLDYPRPLAFAHRGGSAHHPENSWRAFEYAAELGYAYLETDARATSDGVLLAFHDAALDRVTDSSGKVAELPYGKISGARVHGSEPIPLIEDLLGSWPDMRFNIDLKHANAVEPLAQVLKRTGAWSRVCVTSFSGKRLRRAQAIMDRRTCFAVTVGPGAALRYAGLPGQMAARIASAGVQCAQIPSRFATGPFVERAHAAGLQVHVWTVNTKDEMERILDLGADGVMTDEIVLLRDLLTVRGQWHPRAGRDAP